MRKLSEIGFRRIEEGAFMQVFIVRPFGSKGGIDFELVHQKLIQPALDEADIAGGTTGTILEAGNIREDMFQLLLLADLVIADISIHNANVFYELGIRHALRTRQTYLIRAKVGKPKEQLDASDDVPFDLKTDRYLEYDADNPAAAVAALVQGLEQTKASNRIDSPVFRSLPELSEPDHSKLSPVPLAFANDAELAAGKSQGGKLGLLAREAGRFRWEREGRRLVGRCQFDGRFLVSARETWDLVRSTDPLDLEANLRLGTVHQRLGDLIRSDQCLQCVLDNPRATTENRAEALALRGRNAKARGRELFTGKDDAGRRISALRSGFFLEAHNLYARGFEQNLNHYYSGLNALSLTVLLLELIQADRDTWYGMFDRDEEAARKEDDLKTNRDRLAATVGLSIAAAETRAPANEAIWIAISKADYSFLTASRDNAAAAAYERALGPAPSFSLSAARDQLELFRQLNVRAGRVQLCLERFPPTPPPAAALRQAILFTGHMIDAPDRQEPRFPPASEGRAREAIHAEVSQLLDALGGPAIGIAGGANGGDILFHEVCQELGIPTRVLLALPEGPFIAESVAHGGPAWIKRFDALMKSHDGTNEVQVLGSTQTLPEWMRSLQDYDIWQRTNIWLLEEALASGARDLALIALWDGKSGDGPGGTKHLVELARQHGVNTRLLTAPCVAGFQPAAGF